MITKDIVKEVLSLSRISPFVEKNKIEDPKVGLIKGLGVNGFLGSVLNFECETFKAKNPSKGKLRFNETAGSMAKDSVFNASTVIRKLTGLDLNDYDIHLNAIGGGKIDGPSAGVAVTICILSSILNKPVPQNIAITGEISIKGNIKKLEVYLKRYIFCKKKWIKTYHNPKRK